MIEATAILYDGKVKADCCISISGNSEAIAVEYATITKALMQAEGGQAILTRAIDILEKIMKENNDEEER